MPKRQPRTKKNDVLISLDLYDVVKAMSAEEAKAMFLYVLDVGKAACDAGYLKSKEQVKEEVSSAVEMVERQAKANLSAMTGFVYSSIAAKVAAQTSSFYESTAQQAENRSKRTAKEAVELDPDDVQLEKYWSGGSEFSEEQNKEMDLVRSWMKQRGEKTSSKINGVIEMFVRAGGSCKALSMQLLTIPVDRRNEFDSVRAMKEWLSSHSLPRK